MGLSWTWIHKRPTQSYFDSSYCTRGFQVLARRALLRYFIQEIKSARKGRPSIFVRGSALAEDDCRPENHLDRSCPLTLQPGVTFHFFSSHTPCGDASIFPKDGGKRAAVDDDGVGPEAKRRKTDGDDDIHRTGAKCLSVETRQDPRLPGAAYHAVGAVRTKPGRGDRTLSVSCSDKLLRWHSSGVQVWLKAQAIRLYINILVTVQKYKIYYFIMHSAGGWSTFEPRDFR